MGAGRSRRNQAVYNDPYYTGYNTYGGGVAPAYTISTPPSLIETPYEQVDWTEVYVPTARAGGRRPVIYVTAPFPGGLGGYGGVGGFGGAGLGGYGGGFPGVF